MASMNKLSTYCTTVTADAAHRIIVTYHRTQIVKVSHDGTITLDFGGYDTVTTRRKMTQASRQFNLGYSVYRDKGETFVQWRTGQRLPYTGAIMNYIPR